MLIDSNVIHGDSFFVGPYAIALTETELADSVLFKQANPARDIQKVAQVPREDVFYSTKLPILAEHGLALRINDMMLVNKLQGERTEGYRFFQRTDVPEKLKQDVLAAYKRFFSRPHEIEDVAPDIRPPSPGAKN